MFRKLIEIGRHMDHAKNPYNILIWMGRMLDDKFFFKYVVDQAPQVVVAYVNYLDQMMWLRPIDEFFRLFPPIKRYGDDGMWDYHSTLAMIRSEFGPIFCANDLKELLMTACYENRYVQNVGLAYMCRE
jgi:hypothetical protein